nr:MAG TPA: hypothetical protein [Caudoviricetes sp.]DAN63482.1 MAG TPA: hypothetical protein [Caudoviricetes sp.]
MFAPLQIRSVITFYRISLHARIIHRFTISL